MGKYLYSALTKKIVGVAIKVHKTLGSAYEEKIYQGALYLELKKVGVKFEREKEMSVMYDGVRLEKKILDFVIEDKVIIEIKKVDKLSDVHIAQVASYLKATGKKLGLLLNFGRRTLEVKRVIR